MNNVKKECLEEYEVTVTCTGSVTVNARNPEEASDMVLGMSSEEIYKKANLTGFEPSDVRRVGE